MDQVAVVRHKVLVEKKSLRQVARELKIDRGTVKKYLGEPAPTYRRTRPRPLSEVGTEARAGLAQIWESWRGRTTRKQRVTAPRLREALAAEKGIAVGLTLVKDWLREQRRQEAETYVPLEYRPGEVAQVDFFEVTVEVAGQRIKAWKFLMRMMFSGRDFVWLYSRCDQVSFLDGHVRGFEHLGAVPQRCVYDNLKPAVKKVVLGGRDLTERFTALKTFYLFEASFTRPGQGHDKGGVESRGQGIREQHMVPIPQGESLRDIAVGLLVALDEGVAHRTDESRADVAERWPVEQQRMLPLPGAPFEPRRKRAVTLDKQSLAHIDGAAYSGLSHWKLLEVWAYIGPEEVELVCGDERVTHARQGRGGRSVKYRHYLPELARKPQAVRQVAPSLIAELGAPFDQMWQLLSDTYPPQDAARVLAKILGAMVRHGETPVRQALDKTLENPNRVDLLALAQLLPERQAMLKVAVPDRLAKVQVGSAKAADYDYLLKGASLS